MSKILINSATSDKNLELANELQSLLRAMGTDSGLVVLDKLNLPLYSYEAEIELGVIEEKRNFKELYKYKSRYRNHN